MIKVSAKQPIVLCALLALSWSVDAEPTGKGFPIGQGSARLYPSLRVDAVYEDNFYRLSKQLPVTSSWVGIVSPGLSLKTLSGPNAYSLDYRADIGTVEADANDNFVDHTFNAIGNWELGRRHRLRAQYEFMLGHDRRGSGDPESGSRANISSHPDRWRSNRLEGRYSFGAPGTDGRLDFAVAGLARRYLNNDQELRDNDRLVLDGVFSWRIQSKTSVLFQINWQDINYVRGGDGALNSDSQEFRLYTGLRWDATAKTSGEIKLGWLAKDFSDPAIDDYGAFGWEVDLRWRPLMRSTVDLVTSRRATEASDGLSSAVVISSMSLRWVHVWSGLPKLRSEVDLLLAKDDYLDENRTDDRYAAGLGVYYTLRPAVELGASVRRFERASPVRLAEYDNNVVLFTMNARF